MATNEKLNVIHEYLYKIAGPTLIFLGTINCFISLCVFTKKTFRQNPCSIYLISINVVNLLYIYSSIFLATMSFGYNIKIGLYNLFLCRLIHYLSFLFDILSPVYLILLSIDRLLISSRSVRLRQLSNQKFAYKSILIVTLFWIFFHLHSFLFIKQFTLNGNENICYFEKGLYTILVGYYTLIIKGIFIPFLLILFGILTLKNLRQLKSNQSKDRQFLLILLIELFIHITFTISLSIIIIYQQIQYNKQIEEMEEMEKNISIRFLGRFLTHIPFCISSCEYFLVSKSFRKELIVTLNQCFK